MQVLINARRTLTHTLRTHTGSPTRTSHTPACTCSCMHTLTHVGTYACRCPYRHATYTHVQTHARTRTRNAVLVQRCTCMGVPVHGRHTLTHSVHTHASALLARHTNTDVHAYSALLACCTYTQVRTHVSAPTRTQHVPTQVHAYRCPYTHATCIHRQVRTHTRALRTCHTLHTQMLACVRAPTRTPHAKTHRYARMHVHIHAQDTQVRTDARTHTYMHAACIQGCI